MQRSFYSQFDKGFLTRAVTIYWSLRKQYDKQPGKSFQYFMLCLDDMSHDILTTMNLEGVILLRLEDIETNELREIKKNRTIYEYYWTIGPSALAYVLKTYNPETLTYLDADMYFFSSPEPLFQELGENSVLLVPHRLGNYTKVTEAEVGTYNVSLIIFRNDESGLACLNWWRESCNTWCYDRIEDGRYGDQKYLDEFPKRFENVVVTTHKGAGVAPWNIQNYTVTSKAGASHSAKPHVDGEPVIFFHFAKLKIYYPYQHFLPTGPVSSYTLPSMAKKYLYAPYIQKLYQGIGLVEKTINAPFPFGAIARPSLFAQGKNLLGGLFLLLKK